MLISGLNNWVRFIKRYREKVVELWKKWLGRRSQRAHMSWVKFKRILTRYPLPEARAIHSTYCRAANP